MKVFDDAEPRCSVLIAYGTSQKTDRLHTGKFLIDSTERAAYKLAGLSYSTKFSFKLSVELPFNETWFKVPPTAPSGQTPKLGVLHPSLMRRARAAWEAQQST